MKSLMSIFFHEKTVEFMLSIAGREGLPNLHYSQGLVTESWGYILVNILAEAGFVRINDRQGRIRRIFLTDEGRALEKDLRKIKRLVR